MVTRTNNGSKKSGSINGSMHTSALGLVPLQHPNSLGIPPDAPPQIAPDRAVTRQERRIIGALREDGLIIEGTAAKAVYGMRKLGEVQEQASGMFGGTVSQMLDNRNELLGTDVEPYMNEFTTRQIQMYARHMLGALEITGTRIGEQIHSSLDLPPEPLSLRERIFGRRD